MIYIYISYNILYKTHTVSRLVNQYSFCLGKKCSPDCHEIDDFFYLLFYVVMQECLEVIIKLLHSVKMVSCAIFKLLKSGFICK